MWDVWFQGQIVCFKIEHLSNINEIKEKIRVETYPSVFKCVAHLIESFNIIGIISNFFLIGMKSLFDFQYQIIIYHLKLRYQLEEKLFVRTYLHVKFSVPPWK